MIKKISERDIEYIPASHEDPKNPGVFKKVMLRKDDLLDGRIQMINWAKLPKGQKFSKHYHEDMEEIFIILSGKAEIMIGEETEELGKGDLVVIPVRAVHEMKNISKEDVYYIAIGVTKGLGGKTVVIDEI